MFRIFFYILTLNIFFQFECVKAQDEKVGSVLKKATQAAVRLKYSGKFELLVEQDSSTIAWFLSLSPPTYMGPHKKYPDSSLQEALELYEDPGLFSDQLEKISGVGNVDKKIFANFYIQENKSGEKFVFLACGLKSNNLVFKSASMSLGTKKNFDLAPKAYILERLAICIGDSIRTREFPYLPHLKKTRREQYGIDLDSGSYDLFRSWYYDNYKLPAFEKDSVKNREMINCLVAALGENIKRSGDYIIMRSLPSPAQLVLLDQNTAKKLNKKSSDTISGPWYGELIFNLGNSLHSILGKNVDYYARACGARVGYLELVTPQEKDLPTSVKLNCDETVPEKDKVENDNEFEKKLAMCMDKKIAKDHCFELGNNLTKLTDTCSPMKSCGKFLSKDYVQKTAQNVFLRGCYFKDSKSCFKLLDYNYLLKGDRNFIIARACRLEKRPECEWLQYGLDKLPTDDDFVQDSQLCNFDKKNYKESNLMACFRLGYWYFKRNDNKAALAVLEKICPVNGSPSIFLPGSCNLYSKVLATLKRPFDSSIVLQKSCSLFYTQSCVEAAKKSSSKNAEKFYSLACFPHMNGNDSLNIRQYSNIDCVEAINYYLRNKDHKNALLLASVLCSDESNLEQQKGCDLFEKIK